MSRILLIEDDVSISDIERDYLETSGYTVERAFDGKTGLEMIKKGNFDLVVLDLMLPETDGYEILREIGETKDIPVIVLSAKDEEMYKVKALGLGADDYVTKPFGMGEFVARVKGHLKIYEKLKSTGESKAKTITVRGLTIDEKDRRVYINGREVTLTQKEYELLTFLAKNPNRVFSKDQLFERIWGMDALSDTTTVTVHMSKIRDKIEDNPQKPQYIETVWGIGYRFRV